MIYSIILHHLYLFVEVLFIIFSSIHFFSTFVEVPII
jgi:hypothetical protein